MWKNLEERFIELKTLYSSDKNFLDNKSLSINQFLDIAVKCCDSLQEIHSKNIIHKDIKPHNILINTDGTVIKITDFGISTFLNENLNQIYQKATLEGTLPYISPEQTGRVNISLDQRADLYSLGITFYELLTTERPFKSEDPLELIHAHIAKQASRPSKHNPKIPKILDAIILKLMSKPPQERYQSVSGLKEDLVYLRENIEKEGNSISFELGKKDFLNKFQVPEKLYGREKEIELLLSSFQKITEGYVEIASIEGVSGIGKSVLVNEVQKPILEKRGYFLTGKCEQFKRDVPYSVFIQAFQGLFTEFLAESDDEIQKKKKEILSAIGGNAKVVTELFPLLELVVGEQPELEKLSPEANQNRFHLVFSKLLKALATKNRPIVLFLDDMQWIDLASLELLKYLYIK
ncbi:MAG: AAA family ATPase, partial [Leptospiraceae bacterium]|nr:AAA family ATPase [Leptospiraceae bacterium]